MSDLERAVAEMAAAQSALEEAAKRRDDAIREALHTQGATEIARVTGLTRARIYQIAERRR